MSLKAGSGLEKEVTIGPLINQSAVIKVDSLIRQAIDSGAELYLKGGKADESLIYQPVILTDVRSDMRISEEEVFGPVASVFRFETPEEVIELANDAEAGLAAYFFSQNHALIWEVAEALDYGMVGINTGIISDVAAPFGGVKQSGFGREGSKYGMDDYLVTKYLSIQV